MTWPVIIDVIQSTVLLVARRIGAALPVIASVAGCLGAGLFALVLLGLAK